MHQSNFNDLHISPMLVGSIAANRAEPSDIISLHFFLFFKFAPAGCSKYVELFPFPSEIESARGFTAWDFVFLVRIGRGVASNHTFSNFETSMSSSISSQCIPIRFAISCQCQIMEYLSMDNLLGIPRSVQLYGTQPVLDTVPINIPPRIMCSILRVHYRTVPINVI